MKNPASRKPSFIPVIPVAFVWKRKRETHVHSYPDVE
jgi:hypothetical protein